MTQEEAINHLECWQIGTITSQDQWEKRRRYLEIACVIRSLKSDAEGWQQQIADLRSSLRNESEISLTLLAAMKRILKITPHTNGCDELSKIADEAKGAVARAEGRRLPV